jgi:putative PIN family toxin of toxin-antitoxin system
VLRAVLDCNVLVAGLLSPNGPPAELLRRWLEGEFELVASGALVAELERVLAYSKIEQRLRGDQAERFLLLLSEEAVIAPDPVPPPAEVRELPSDPDDAYLIRLAVAERAVIVSGDRHLTAMAPDFPVHTPADFVIRLDASQL